ncbi:hypothetical protein ERHA55_48160 [Erwinia rhapontici]|nr:hypothetical protein ERHA55_48160 [Erwinia rhapontici]
MFMTPGIAISVWLIPVWLLVLTVSYQLRKKKNTAHVGTIVETNNL